MDQGRVDTLDTACEMIGANRLPEAVALLGQHIYLHPDDERAWHMLSLALPDPEKQAYALRRVLQLNPGNRAARSQLARLSSPPPVQSHLAAERASLGRSGISEAGLPAGPSPLARSETGQRKAKFDPSSLSHRAPKASTPDGAPRAPSTVGRLVRYVSIKTIGLSLTVVVGLFLAILAINYGGYIDEIFEANIEESLGGLARGLSDVPPEEIPQILDNARQAMRQAYGLNDPFLLRCFRWLVRGLTLNWGEAERIGQARGLDTSVRGVILERLPNSLLLAGAGNLLLFVASLLLALALSRKYGSLVDKLIVGLSPLSAAPAWVHGILLTVVFAAGLRLLPFGGMFDELPPAQPLGYVPIVARHMILPVAAIFMATFFQSVYAWRTFFVLHSREDYVEVAEAKGLSKRMVERRYILRPTLPFIITSFALVLITFWQGLLILEVFFHWPGIGSLFIEAIKANDRPVLVGLLVMFAYLLMLTTFLLDFAYAVVDPRVRIDSRRPRASRSRRVRRVRLAGLQGPPLLARRPRGPRGVWRQNLKTAPGRWVRSARRLAHGLGSTLREMLRYPSTIAGLLLIAGLLGMAFYAVTNVPLEEAIRQSRGSRVDWYEAPKYARPVWVNLFRSKDLPPTIMMDSTAGTATKVREIVSDDMTRVSISFPFDFSYGVLPQDIILFVQTQYEEKRPHLVFTWTTPDGREIEFANFSLPSSADTYYLSGDESLARRWKDRPPLEVLFLPPDGGTVPLQGRYVLGVEGFVFEDDSDVDARFVLDGQVYGLAGTDNLRRDLMIPLLWGAPVALVFGLLGAVATSIASVVIAGVGTWLGGWADDLVQRLTEVNMILPALPIAIMVYQAYSKNIWVILAVMVLLSIFGSSIKSYRAIFLQAKEAPYVEAALVYGASNWRIILRYLVPRVVPVLVPQLVILIPGYVFLEATLAYLGVVDPILPTWGKVVYEALNGGAFQGHYHWVLEPIALLLLTGLAFALLGYSLDRILNPRLRSL